MGETERERRLLIATHEAGHAISALALGLYVAGACCVEPEAACRVPDTPTLAPWRAGILACSGLIAEQFAGYDVDLDRDLDLLLLAGRDGQALAEATSQVAGGLPALLAMSRELLGYYLPALTALPPMLAALGYIDGPQLRYWWEQYEQREGCADE